jgi:hypothetical protein
LSAAPAVAVAVAGVAGVVPSTFLVQADNASTEAAPIIKTRDFINIVRFLIKVSPAQAGAAGTHLTSLHGQWTVQVAEFMLVALKKAYNSGF